jgi:hypothetical protein
LSPVQALLQRTISGSMTKIPFHFSMIHWEGHCLRILKRDQSFGQMIDVIS